MSGKSEGLSQEEQEEKAVQDAIANQERIIKTIEDKNAPKPEVQHALKNIRAMKKTTFRQVWDPPTEEEERATMIGAKGEPIPLEKPR